MQQLEKLLTTQENSGITLNFPKCSFAVARINIFRHILSASGIQLDEAKVEAVNNAPPPKSASEVQSFLELTTIVPVTLTDHCPGSGAHHKAKANNPGKPPPARIERWKLRLQEYDFKVVYRPGVNNLADSLSAEE